MYKVRKSSVSSNQNTEGYSVKGRVWVEKDGELYLGWGRIILLEKIEELGSIAAAARSMKLSYRNAWLWIDSMNKLAPEPLVEKSSGGENGGYARVTEAGKREITHYNDLREKFSKLVNQMR